MSGKPGDRATVRNRSRRKPPELGRLTDAHGGTGLAAHPLFMVSRLLRVLHHDPPERGDLRQTGNRDKKKPRTREGSGTKYSIRKNLDYFLYLMAVPVSLTVTVLIPQMQFMS